jgi:hypothetical protein
MVDQTQLTGPAQTFRKETPFSKFRSSSHLLAEPNALTPSLLLLPRLITFASVTVKRSVWAFPTPKLELSKD